MKSTRFRIAASLAVACVMTMLAAQSAQAQTYKVLHTFTGGHDGGSPLAGVIQDSKSNLYGTTRSGGGTGCDGSGCGVVFRLDSTGKETVLYSFTGGADGSEPWAGVIHDPTGNLYGTTVYGGDLSCHPPYGCGVVFKLSKSGKETVLYSFKGGIDGTNPVAGLIRDAQGNLYGTTFGGGESPCACGVVFKLSRTGKETVLYAFTGGDDGATPAAGVIQDAMGNLYGTTFHGGASSSGTVFKVSRAGKETVLHSFTGGADGAAPLAALIQDASGNLYGTASSGGGASEAGVVFKLSGAGKETVLYTFTGGADGAQPVAGLIQGARGSLYGTTLTGGDYDSGTVFKLSKTGKEVVLHTFTVGGGTYPSSGLIQNVKGSLYGTTFTGGYFNSGEVFKLTP